MAETRILLLSSRDPQIGAPDEPPLVALKTGAAVRLVREDSVEVITADLIAAIADAPGVRVAHRPVGRPSEVVAAIGDHRPDIVFNICESLVGDSRLEVTAAWLLDRLGLPFTGSPYSALRHCLFKVEASQLLARAGVRVPWTARIHSPNQVRAGGLASEPWTRVPFPVIVKPEREDGSLGIGRRSVVGTWRRLREQVAEVLETCHQPAVVQQYIDGRELSVSLLGWPVPRVLPLGEITFGALPKGHPRILTYASKWLADSDEYGGTPSVAAVLRPRELRRVAAIGRRAFEVLGLRDYGRVDVRLDGRGDPYVIDVNPNCDLSPDGGFAKAAKRAGLDYTETIWEILRGAIRRRPDGAALFASRGRSPRPASSFALERPVALDTGT